MTSSLLKRSLELFREDLTDLEEAGFSKKERKQTPLNTNKRGMKKHKRKVKSQQKADTKLLLRKSVGDVRPGNPSSSQLEDNLSMINQLSHLETVQQTTVTKILQHHQGRLSRDRPKEEQVPEVDASILFNIRDFDENKETNWDI